MTSAIYGGIDIGSNAVRLIVKSIIPGKTYKDAIVKTITYVRLPMRLGGDVFKYGEIREQKANNFVKGMKIYKDLMDFYGVEKYRACATSATRGAKNGEEVVERVKRKTGIEIDVIDGTEESMLLFETNRYNLPDGKTFLSADLGGGSLQMTLFQDDELIWTHSYKIGTVRILNETVNPAEYEALEKKLKEIKEEYGKVSLIGSGGNINKISKMVKEKTVEDNDIEKIIDMLKPLSVEERMIKHELKKDRADVIIPASEIYLKVMKHTHNKKIYVPKIGLADGVIRQLYEQSF